MDVALLARATEEFAGYLSEVTDSELTAETPCAGWTIDDLFQHMIEENIAFGQSINPHSRAPQRTMNGAPRETIYRASARYALDTVAAVADATDRFELHLANTLVHTWDLASAIEFDYDLPSARALEIARDRLRRIPPNQRGIGKDFGDIADFPTGSAIEEILVLSGRSPAWRAGNAHIAQVQQTCDLVSSLHLSRQRNRRLQALAESRGLDASTLTRQWIIERLDEPNKSATQRP